MLRRFITNTTARIRAETEASSFSLLTHAQFALAFSSLVAAGGTACAVHRLSKVNGVVRRYHRCIDYAEEVAAITVFGAVISPVVLNLWSAVLMCGGGLAAALVLFSGTKYVANKILHAAIDDANNHDANDDANDPRM